MLQHRSRWEPCLCEARASIMFLYLLIKGSVDGIPRLMCLSCDLIIVTANEI